MKPIRLSDYPDIININQMREMLGGIGINLAYKLLKNNTIKSRKIGREYRILKISIIEYMSGCGTN